MTRDGSRLSPRESSHASGALGYRTEHTLYFSLRLGVFALKISAPLSRCSFCSVTFFAIRFHVLLNQIGLIQLHAQSVNQ